MVNIVGQEKLLKTLDSYTLDTLPKTLLLIGEQGCGKHTFSLHLATKLGMPLVDITDNITPEQLIEYSHRPYNTMYRINLDNFDEKHQNQFLKFIEEPAASVFIVLIASTEIGILPTVLNRCIKYTFEDYTVEQLQEFKWLFGDVDDSVFHICKTPGQLSGVNFDALAELKIYCQDLMHNINKLDYAQLLSIILKVNTKEDYDKYDFDIFLNTLEYYAFDSYINEANKQAYTIYELTNKYKQRLMYKTVLKENLLFNFLTTLWEATR